MSFPLGMFGSATGAAGASSAGTAASAGTASSAAASAAATSSKTGAGRPAAVPWRRKAWLFIGGLAWLLLLLAMVTHDAGDPAFTTSGSGEPVRNRVGLLGARVADMAYFLFGFSA